jgi:hypothetical protein
MFEKNTLFYAANVEPEIARMFTAFDNGDVNSAEKFKLRTIDMINEILSKKEISSAGLEEWFTIRNMVMGYNKLDDFSRKVVLLFGKPFSEKFMSRFA